MPPELDIVIPVYNEGGNIVATLAGLAGAVTTSARVLICYDHADDDTLPAIKDNPQAHAGLPVDFVRNAGRGAHSAVMTGFAASTAPFVLMYPADDHTNARSLARGLAQIPLLDVQQPETNLVFIGSNSPRLTPEKLQAELRAKGVLVSMLGGRVRACTHLDVTAAMVDETVALAREIARAAS